MHEVISHASRRLLDVILCRSFTRPSTPSAVIEGLGTRLEVVQAWTYIFVFQESLGTKLGGGGGEASPCHFLRFERSSNNIMLDLIRNICTYVRAHSALLLEEVRP